MAVDENARGRGYGSRILEGLEAEAARRGAQKLVLNAPDNVNGILCQARLCGGWCGRNAFWRDSPSADREGVVIRIFKIGCCPCNYVLNMKLFCRRFRDYLSRGHSQRRSRIRREGLKGNFRWVPRLALCDCGELLPASC